MHTSNRQYAVDTGNDSPRCAVMQAPGFNVLSAGARGLMTWGHPWSAASWDNHGCERDRECCVARCCGASRGSRRGVGYPDTVESRREGGGSGGGRVMGRVGEDR